MAAQQTPVFLLSGPPGAGKSSVAQALLQRFAHGLHIPVDDLREWVVAGIAHPVPEWTAETTRQFALARRAAAHVALLYQQAGFAVAVDDVIAPLDAAADYAELFAGAAVQPVLLLPDLQTVLQRNATRNNKAFDPAMLVQAISRLHSELSEQQETAGWLVVDSSGMDLRETVDAILRRLAGRT